MESGKQVISKTADCSSNHQRAEIATGHRLSQALIMMTWDDDFDKRCDREPRRRQQLESTPEIEVLKRSVVRAVVEGRRLAVDANWMSTTPLIFRLDVGKGHMDRDPVAQPVLDVPKKGVAVSPLSRPSGLGELCAMHVQLAVRADVLIRNADGALTGRGNKRLCRYV
jgi:hypothetical protein